MKNSRAEKQIPIWNKFYSVPGAIPLLYSLSSADPVPVSSPAAVCPKVKSNHPTTKRVRRPSVSITFTAKSEEINSVAIGFGCTWRFSARACIFALLL